MDVKERRVCPLTDTCANIYACTQSLANAYTLTHTHIVDIGTDWHIYGDGHIEEVGVLSVSVEGDGGFRGMMSSYCQHVVNTLMGNYGANNGKLKCIQLYIKSNKYECSFFWIYYNPFNNVQKQQLIGHNAVEAVTLQNRFWTKEAHMQINARRITSFYEHTFSPSAVVWRPFRGIILTAWVIWNAHADESRGDR